MADDSSLPGKATEPTKPAAPNGPPTDALEHDPRTLSLLIDSAIDHAICMLDPDGRVRVWNKGAERLFGWSAADMIGLSHACLYQPADQASGLPKARRDRVQREGRLAERLHLVHRSGKIFCADIILNRIDAPDGSLLGFGKVIRDVTHELAEAAENAAHAVHLRSILATVPDAMIVIDEAGIILSFSSAAEAMFGYPEAEVVGHNVAMLMPSPDREAHDGHLARYHATGRKYVIGQARRVFGLRKDGTTFPHELIVAETIGGGQRFFTGFLRDLTVREDTEARLQELQSELFHISRVSAVGTMASTLAHELNQPLTAVTNYVQTSAALLENVTQGPDVAIHDALVEAGREALRAGAIVRRLREFVARGELDRTIEPVAPLIADALALGMAGARLMGIRVETDIAQGCDAALIDRVQIQQVLVNLLRNAVEAIDPETQGCITLTVAPDQDMLRFTVADNGHGLTAEAAATLFTAFVSTKARGMGLGLSICRTIIEAHGGRIWCDPASGGGAAFHFTVPAVGEEIANA